VARFEKPPPENLIKARIIAHCKFILPDSAMTGVPTPVGRHGKISTTGATGIWRTGAACDLLQRNREIGEADWQAGLSSDRFASRDEFQGFEIKWPIMLTKSLAGTFIHAQRRETNFCKAQIENIGEALRKIDVVACHRCPSGNLRQARFRQKGDYGALYGRETTARCAAATRPLLILYGNSAINADRNSHSVRTDQFNILRTQESTVRDNGKTQV
jgi:hypothetical protein